MIHTDAGYYTPTGLPPGASGPSYVHLWYLKDHLGNNRVLANERGIALSTHHYDPYGTEISISISNPSNPFLPGMADSPYKYGGKEWNAATSTYDFEARYLSPGFHRFTTMDPLCEKYYSISPYAYCFGNPIKYADSNGRDGWDTTMGYVIGAITNIIPISSKLRDLYRPQDAKDYNGALEKSDKVTSVIGAALVEGGLLLTGAGEIISDAGIGLMGTGGALVLSGAAIPEGGAIVVGGTQVTAVGATTTSTGVATTTVGMGLMMNAANNSSQGYDRGRTSNVQDNGKNEKHGDGGRTVSKTEKQRFELQERIKNASSKKERRDLETKLKHINQDAERKAKGEEHSRGLKR